MLMASSIVGVFSIFHTISMELSSGRHSTATPTLSSSSFLFPLHEKAHFNSLVASGAFRGLSDHLSDLDGNDDDVRSRDHESETENAGGERLPDEDELAISKLGLLMRLVKSLEKCVITHLFSHSGLF